MSLYERLCGRDEAGIADENLQKISIDQFSALLIEFTFDSIPRQNIIDNVGMIAAVIVQLDSILAKGANQNARRELYIRIRSMLH